MKKYAYLNVIILVKYTIMMKQSINTIAQIYSK